MIATIDTIDAILIGIIIFAGFMAAVEVLRVKLRQRRRARLRREDRRVLTHLLMQFNRTVEGRALRELPDR